ncbi:hypothetical protein BKA81DRAFT_382407 [Phyllosticta paracitricarpa]|uniref:Uncharacterized protein n=1 Tax=Phyllosticta citricarpa TaxID=55181 RepID=A0ABR1LTC1_9PEZI
MAFSALLQSAIKLNAEADRTKAQSSALCSECIYCRLHQVVPKASTGLGTRSKRRHIAVSWATATPPPNNSARFSTPLTYVYILSLVSPDPSDLLSGGVILGQIGYKSGSRLLREALLFREDFLRDPALLSSSDWTMSANQYNNGESSAAAMTRDHWSKLKFPPIGSIDKEVTELEQLLAKLEVANPQSQEEEKELATYRAAVAKLCEQAALRRKNLDQGDAMEL